MIKARGRGPQGRDTLFIGLSFANLEKFINEPLDTHIVIRGQEVGLPHDVMLFSGRTEADMADLLAGSLEPGAKVHVSLRSKN